MNTESITTSDIAVAVGEVSISGKYGATVEDQNPQFLRIYKIVFTANANNINTVKTVEAEDSAAYNLAGQKVADGFKGIVVKNGRKMIQK